VLGTSERALAFTAWLLIENFPFEEVANTCYLHWCILMLLTVIIRSVRPDLIPKTWTQREHIADG
jgi:hypothetical protein